MSQRTEANKVGISGVIPEFRFDPMLNRKSVFHQCMFIIRAHHVAGLFGGVVMVSIGVLGLLGWANPGPVVYAVLAAVLAVMLISGYRSSQLILRGG